MGYKPRRPAEPGLSLVDANRGRLVTYGPDVLDVKARIEREWAGLLSCFFDEDNEEWVVVQKDEDGTDSIAFTTTVLSQATIDKIHRCDQTSRSYVDPNDAYEAADKEEERYKDWKLSEQIGEASERLYSALRKDGIIDRPQVFFS
jgi:hypothetical protein